MGNVGSMAETGGVATIITIECRITKGLTNVIIVGFANRAVDEANERLRGAFHASKIEFPKQRIAINPTPADIPKESSSFDLRNSDTITPAHISEAMQYRKNTSL